MAALEGKPDPTSLAPTGPAGGDLNGTYPNPQVTETGLAVGGDLIGTVASSQISTGSVDDAELADRTRSLVFPASEIGDAGIANPPQNEPLIGSNSFAPALAFPDGSFTDIVLDPLVPADRVPGGDFEVRIYWSVATQPAAGETDVIWRAELLGVGAGEDVDASFDPQVEAAPQGAGTADTLRIQTIVLPGDAIANGDLLLMRVMRMAAGTAGFEGDTLTQDALLHAVELRYSAVR